MSFDSPLPPYNASDPSATFLSASCLDLLMIEIVPMAWRVVREVNNPANTNTNTNTSLTANTNQDGSVGGVSVGDGGELEQEERDAVFYRLEGLGYRVGQGLVERFSRDRPRFTDTLDVIKFLCKELWMLVFGKQIDNLKTNHRGVYVLTDSKFKPLIRMSAKAGGMAVVRAQPFLWFPCGIIRGALASMGINATVQAETNEIPMATFQIKSVGVKA